MSNDINDPLGINSSSQKQSFEETNPLKPTNNKRIGLIIGIIGIALIFIAQTQTFTKYVIGYSEYGSPRINTTENTSTKNIILYLGVIALIIGGVFFAKSFNSKNNEQIVSNIREPLPNATQENDVFIQIEKLNDLRQKDIITEEEFNSKKVELLSKL